MIINIKVHTNARHNRIVAYEDGCLNIQLNALPEKGKANKALIKLLAKTSGIAQSDIHIRQGSQSRHKRVEIAGHSEDAFTTFLESLPSGQKSEN